MSNVLTDITQLAIVTPDLDGTIRGLQKTLNLGAFKVWNFSYPALFDTTLYDRAEAWSMKLGISWIGDTQLEVIQPLGGENLYQKYLDWKGRAGLQHFLIDRDKTPYADMKAKFAQSGFPIVQEGKTNVAVTVAGITVPPLPMILARSLATTFGYTDTFDRLKISVEVSKFPPGISPRFGLRMAKADYWVGEDKGSFEKLPEDSLISAVSKLYILVENVDDTLRHFQNFQVDPLQSLETTISDVETGSAFRIKLAFINMRSTQLVLLQPLEGDNLFASMMRERGEGGHLMGALSRHANKAQLVEHFRDKGLRLALSVNVGKQELCYFYDPRLPFAVEIAL